MTADSRRPDEAIHVRPWPDGANAFDDLDEPEAVPFAARPMFTVAELVLLGIMIGILMVTLYIGLAWTVRP